MEKIFKNFNPNSMEHVKWLQCIHRYGHTMDVSTLNQINNTNPFIDKIKPLDIPEIQFVLDAKYVEAIFEKKAYIL